MAGKTTVWSEDILNLILNGEAIANIADNTASSPLTNLYISLHTADPGISGNQTTHEAAYTSYARVAVARSSGSPAWTIVGESAAPNAAITFPTASGGSETETYMGIGSAPTGSGVLYYSGAISPSIVVSSGVTPQLTTATSLTEI